MCIATHLNECLHFVSDDGYCLPVFLVCNGVLDCPGHEDEQDCDSYTCPGYYRCHASNVCLHPDNVCDGMMQCPRSDDEMICNFTCPVTCTCHGHAFFCPRPVHLRKFSRLRYLDASGSGMSPDDVSQNSLLVYLSLANCGLPTLNTLAMSNLRHLDLSNNFLASFMLYQLYRLPNLMYLRLSSNPIKAVFSDSVTQQLSVFNLRTLDLSRVAVKTLCLDVFSFLPNLRELNLSESKVSIILKSRFEKSKDILHTVNTSAQSNGSQTMEGRLLLLRHHNSESQTLVALRILDLRGCRITNIPVSTFAGLKNLLHVYADSYRLCCGSLYPQDFNLNNCESPLDLVSTCKYLLGSNHISVFVPTAACLSLSGNAILFVVRVVFRRWRAKSGLDVYMSHITVCDFGMGVYLAVISTAHWVHQGHYAQTDITWRHSGLCQMTGLVYCTVNTVSVLLVFLASGYSVLTTRFPRAVTGHRPLMSHVVCGLAWVTGLTVASIPLLVPHWKFYSHSSTCLPILTDTSASQGARNVFVFGLTVVTFVASALSGVGQCTLWTSTHRQTLTGASWVVSDDVVMIRRLHLEFSKSVMCWLLNGMTVFFQWHDLNVSSNLVLVVYFVLLPSSSTVNCFLYVRSIYEEHRRQHRTQRLMTYLKAKSRNVCPPNT